MKTLVLANQKGGVGKSAIATQLAYHLSKAGQRVLFVDLDHQRNSTAALVKSGLVAAASFNGTELLSADGDRALPDSPFVLVPGDDNLSLLERQAQEHNRFVNRLSGFLKSNAQAFDVCLIDTNPNPDIRYASALVVSDYVLSPIQLNQEALAGIGALLTHSRYGYRKIKQTINAKLDLIGILPNMVEATPFQKANFEQLAKAHSQLLIPNGNGGFAFLPKRSAVAEAQASGAPLYSIKKTAARDAWLEMKAVFDVIANHMKLELK